MKSAWLMLLVSLFLAGCIVEPGRGYGERGWGGGGYSNQHDEQGPHADWGR